MGWVVALERAPPLSLNDKLLAIVSRDTGIRNAFAMCDDILKQAVEGISDLITQTGIINVDFADVRAVMENAGSALMGIGTAIGEKRAEVAARDAINSPLLEVSVNGAKGVLFSVAGGDDLGMLEVQDAANVITEAIDPDAKVIFGTVVDPMLKKGAVRVTVIATGFPDSGVRSSLFSASQRLTAKKDQDVPPASLRSRTDSKRDEVEVSEKVSKDAVKSTSSSRSSSEGDDDDAPISDSLPPSVGRAGLGNAKEYFCISLALRRQ
ncbi:MAG: Cell division protein ftsZ [Candidatus Adlerbacteria bacterium GW2011_GWC1_50_9]|uniref:Cell division protein ftsZ n=1 Tax=Candidatus Adlerbacteria bacterium GW2011_GWC1_50_9 TaxID=1618608 RepID=A0A0G1YUH2_9BACT|nr:MAG: Cell division protein ftsZ [Candidatus Adlerbacteria bacterium GW2011_GWC1_50_9]